VLLGPLKVGVAEDYSAGGAEEKMGFWFQVSDSQAVLLTLNQKPETRNSPLCISGCDFASDQLVFFEELAEFLQTDDRVCFEAEMIDERVAQQVHDFVGRIGVYDETHAAVIGECPARFQLTGVADSLDLLADLFADRRNRFRRDDRLKKFGFDKHFHNGVPLRLAQRHFTLSRYLMFGAISLRPRGEREYYRISYGEPS
jgi:hypothetical protein